MLTESYRKELIELFESDPEKAFQKFEEELLPAQSKQIKFQNRNRLGGIVNDLYTGEVNKTGQRHGIGKLEHDGLYDKHIYIGEWLDDQENGFGIVFEGQLPESKYIGGFKNNKKSDHGILFLRNWSVYDRYEGEFGNYKYDEYDILWRNGCLQGHGTCRFANGNYYEGEFLDGKRRGQGIFICANGFRFHGEWEGNSFCTDSFQNDSSTKEPVLVIEDSNKEDDSRTTYHYIVFPRKKGIITYRDATIIGSGTIFDEEKPLINILEVTDDSITYEVRDEYFSDGKKPPVRPYIDTIHRNEKKSYTGIHEHSCRYDGDDVEWTDINSLTVICK